MLRHGERMAIKRVYIKQKNGDTCYIKEADPGIRLVRKNTTFMVFALYDGKVLLNIPTSTIESIEIMEAT